MDKDLLVIKFCSSFLKSEIMENIDIQSYGFQRVKISIFLLITKENNEVKFTKILAIETIPSF